MRFFACAVRMDGGPVPASFSDTIARSRPMTQLGSHTARGFLGLASADDFGGPVVARLGAAIGIGVARLDNRAEVLRLLSRRDDDVSDLGLVMQFVTRDQGARIGRLEGDFSFVVWDPTSGCLLAARDTFGVRKLYYAGPRDGLITFCSHASPLAAGDSCSISPSASRTVLPIRSGRCMRTFERCPRRLPFVYETVPRSCRAIGPRKRRRLATTLFFRRATAWMRFVRC